MRQIQDEQGRTWEVVAVPSTGAHMRPGAVLGFRPADDSGAEPVRTPVDFNSQEAAAFAIRTMSEWELKRRLGWARTEAGIA
jgi:hypothetical protein